MSRFSPAVLILVFAQQLTLSDPGRGSALDALSFRLLPLLMASILTAMFTAVSLKKNYHTWKTDNLMFSPNDWRRRFRVRIIAFVVSLLGIMLYALIATFSK